jgi:hypothetical protein
MCAFEPGGRCDTLADSARGGVRLKPKRAFSVIVPLRLGAASDGREFDPWLIDKNGGVAERVTSAPSFDGFPQFSPDGTCLVWDSNRANPKRHETNLFLAHWVN